MGLAEWPLMRRVQLRRRHEEDLESKSSTFARLSRGLVPVLYQEALGQARARLGNANHLQYGWNILSRSESEPIDFLPLAIKFNSITVYASYNGGEAKCDDNDGDVLELPSSMIPSGVSEDSEVMVTALAEVRDADILTVEPLTPEDWELLEIKAEFLEGGTFLRQVSLVYAGQIIRLWVGGHDVAWIRVLTNNFADTPCLRLVQDTRISLVPKPRPVVDPGIQELRLHPTSNDYSQPMNELAKSLGKPLVFTTPGTAFVNPASKDAFFGPFEESEESPKLAVLWNATLGRSMPPTANSCLVQIAYSNDIPKHHIGVHFLTRARLNLVPLLDTVLLKSLSPIEVVRGSSILRELEEDREGPMELMPVKTYLVRTGAKWRYPADVSLDSTKAHGTDHDKCFVSGEPLEDGSFVVVGRQTGNHLHRVALRSDSSHFCGDNKASAVMERCFILRKDFPRYVTTETACVLTSVDQQVHASWHVSRLAPSPFEILQRPQLLNLLSETYVVPSNLNGDTKFWSTRGSTLIYGDPGSGKTHTALLVAAIERLRNNTTTFYLDCKKLKETRVIRMNDILGEINAVFDEAFLSAVDSTIILDDLDNLAPNLEQDNHGTSARSHQVNPLAADQAKLIADTLRSHFVRKQTWIPSGRRISLIITCRDVTSLIPSIVNTCPFACTMRTPILTALEKERVLWTSISPGTRLSSGRSEATFRSRRLGRKCDICVPQDLMLVASRVKQSLRICGVEFSAEALAEYIEKELENFTPQRNILLNDNVSGAADWNDIGGLFDVKESLASTMLNPAKYRPIYSRAKIRLPRGVLLFGYPGCGKSYVVPAVAKKCGFSLITCRGPEILDRYIGASESKVRELFARAAAASPAVLFFDEIDSLAPRRGSDKTGVTDRVVNQLLTLLDGVEDIGGTGMVYIIAATSRPDIVDPALLRPGRLEKHVYVGYPESEDETTDIMTKISALHELDEALRQLISSGQIVRELKSSCPTFDRLSPADLKAAFITAQLNAIHDILQTDPTNKKVVIGRRHLLTALRATKPSLPERDYCMLMSAYRCFRKGRELTGDLPKAISELRTALQ